MEQPVLYLWLIFKYIHVIINYFCLTKYIVKDEHIEIIYPYKHMLRKPYHLILISPLS